MASTASSRSGSRCSGGTRKGTPASRIFRLARTSRWPIVVSGTRNARAISVVVRPPTAREGQCDLGLGRERRMAAGEDQAESFIWHGFVAVFLALQLG